MLQLKTFVLVTTKSIESTISGKMMSNMGQEKISAKFVTQDGTYTYRVLDKVLSNLPIHSVPRPHIVAK